MTALRPRARDSRALLEQAARIEFAEFGYAGARVNRIARRAGVNKQLLFYYFGSKRELYDSIVDQLTREVIEAGGGPATRGRHPSESLRAAFFKLFDSVSARPELVRLLAIESKPHGGSTRRPGRALAGLLGQLQVLVREGQGHGYFRDDVDARLVAQHALILALGYVAFQGLLADASPSGGEGDAEEPPTTAATWKTAAADILVRTLTW
jgi:AcrR family transcriptional regulator